MRRCVMMLALVLGWAWTSCSTVLADPIRLSTWPSLGKNAPFYMGLEHGIYRADDIDLEIIQTRQSALVLLASGQAEVAQVLVSEAAAAIINGVDLKIIAVRDSKFPVATISLREKNIKSPRDYIGRSWAVSQESPVELLAFQYLAQQEAIEPAKVRIERMSWESQLPALIAGQVDIISAWYGSGYPAKVLAATAKGVDVDVVWWAKYGVDLYGECLVVESDWLKKHVGLAERFLRATKASFLASIDAPDEAVQAVLARDPRAQGKREEVALGWQQAAQLAQREGWPRDRLLALESAVLKRTIVTLVEQSDGMAQINVNDWVADLPGVLAD
jgi:NitT/TauT family transport system substrate-binding protein